jgi:hypothetical protein
MNDEQQLLASAYLDDALTDEERTRAEADPDVMAAVEQLRELRRALSAVDPPDRARRDAAINAALAAFDAERRPAAPPPVSSLASRRASKWIVAAAAALVLVIAGGILASRGDDGGGDDSAGGGAAATEAATDEQLLSDTAGGGAEATTGGTAATPEADTRAADDTAAAAPTPETAGAAAGTAVPAATTYSAEQLLPPAEALLELATTASKAAPTSDLAPKCSGGRFLGRHVLRIDGKNTRVEIFYNRRAGEYIALNAQTCEPLISIPAP